MTDLRSSRRAHRWLDCDVIQADGGTRTASITGAFVALALALERLVAAGILRTVPLDGSGGGGQRGIGGVRSCWTSTTKRIRSAEVDMNVVMTGSGRFVEVQATAEGRPYTGNEMQQLLELAAAGIEHLTKVQRELLHMKFSAQAR